MSYDCETGIKTRDTERLLELLDQYFQIQGLQIVEENIAGKVGKFVTSPKGYPNLEEYDKIAYPNNPEQSYKFTTNFDLISNLNENPDWCVLRYPAGFAEYTLNIDSTLTSFLSKKLQTKAFDWFYYSVPNQQIIRGYENGEVTDKLFMSGEGSWGVDMGEGYFEKLRGLEDEDISEEELEKKLDIVLKFWDYIGYHPVPFQQYYNNHQKRRPLYLKGKEDKIMKFFTEKESSFYLV